MGGGRPNNQTQRQGNQSSNATGGSTVRAPQTGGKFGLGFAGDYPNTAGGPYDFGRNPWADVNATYVDGAGQTRGMSGAAGVRDGIFTNKENNNYKWLGSPNGVRVTLDRYSSPEQALNTRIGDRQHDMAGGDWGAYLSLINQQNGQVGLGAIQKAQSRGATQDQLDRFFTHSGISLGQAAKDAGFGTDPYNRPGSYGYNGITSSYEDSLAAGGATNSGAPNSGQQAGRGITRGNNLRQNLNAAAGVNNVLSDKELLSISKKNDRDPEKVLERAVGRGMLIGQGVVNKYQKGKYTDPRLIGYEPDSAILQQLLNAGRQDKGSALFIGSKGSTATTLPRRIMSGVGGYKAPGAGGGTTTATPTAGVRSTPATNGPMTPTEMQAASTVTPAVTPDSMVSGAGSVVPSTATGFRSPKRSRQKAGRNASGYGSKTIRNAPGYASGVGLN